MVKQTNYNSRNGIPGVVFLMSYHVTISDTGLISLGLRGHVPKVVKLSLFRCRPTC